jgi:hypothetical protein
MDCTVFRAYKNGNKSNFAFVYSNGIVCVGGALMSTVGEYRSFITDIDKIKKVRSDKRIVDALHNMKVSDIEIEIINPSKILDDVHGIELYLLLLAWVTLRVENKQLKLYTQYVKIFSNISNSRNYLTLFSIVFSEKVAQKLVPIPQTAVNNIEDYTYSIWKEIAISNLNINGVVKLEDWFYIKRSGKYLYDTPILRRKFVISEDVEEFLLDINKVRNNIKIDDSGLNMAIQFPIYYAKQQLLLSDMSVCLLYPSKGISVDSLKNIKPDLKRITNILVNLNSNGVIHGDLHSGNITWDGKEYWLIDFSESIIFDRLDDIILFYKNYFQTFYEENEDVLKRMANTEKQLLFNIWTAWDWYKLSSDMINNPQILCREDLPKVKKINEYAFTHITNINKEAPNFNNYLLTLGLLKGKIPS